MASASSVPDSAVGTPAVVRSAPSAPGAACFSSMIEYSSIGTRPSQVVVTAGSHRKKRNPLGRIAGYCNPAQRKDDTYRRMHTSGKSAILVVNAESPARGGPTQKPAAGQGVTNIARSGSPLPDANPGCVELGLGVWVRQPVCGADAARAGAFRTCDPAPVQAPAARYSSALRTAVKRAGIPAFPQS